MRTLVVIVNFRTAELVIDCLASLEAEVAALPGTRVAVVDNASGGNDVERLEQAISDRGWSCWASVDARSYNGGFAYGNNAAMLPAIAGPDAVDYVWMLNPDTYIRSGALIELVDFLELHPEVGLAGGRLEEPDGQRQDSCFRFHGAWTEIEHGLRLGIVSRLLRSRRVAPPQPVTAACVDWVMGASLLVRREVLEAIGGMDEEYFLYYEETDFCLRAARAGWSTWFVPESRVVHLVGKSSGVTDVSAPAKRRPRYWFESRRRYFEKNHGLLFAGWVDLLWIVTYGSFCLRNLIQRKPTEDPPRFLRDFLAFTLGPKRRPEPAVAAQLEARPPIERAA